MNCKMMINKNKFKMNHSIGLVHSSITSRNNAPISNFGGIFRCKREYPWCIIIEVKSKYFPTVYKKNEKNQKKFNEKQEFLRKTSFRPKRFFYMRKAFIVQIFTKSVENAKICNKSRRYLKILPVNWRFLYCQ
ncbi:Uncharacterized protein FWK35_00018790 [Aphis craccivora]|uniref:Uncharacterized protein n=1 Tax=Aphis craccivora TaxID=307492 RepID=A0A6G0Y8R5_APHCR|nr:Uncharacterized protein FWK35_00018790 [Aphis craccivora]